MHCEACSGNVRRFKSQLVSPSKTPAVTPRAFATACSVSTLGRFRSRSRSQMWPCDNPHLPANSTCDQPRADRPAAIRWPIVFPVIPSIFISGVFLAVAFFAFLLFFAVAVFLTVVFRDFRAVAFLAIVFLSVFSCFSCFGIAFFVPCYSIARGDNVNSYIALRRFAAIRRNATEKKLSQISVFLCRYACNVIELRLQLG